MIINRVRIRNYRSIIDSDWVNIEEDITTLIGKNESGKSSFLRAISSIKDEASYSDKELNYNSEVTESEPIVSLEVTITDKSITSIEGVGDEIRIDKYPDGQRKVFSGDNVDPTLLLSSAIESAQSAAENIYTRFIELRDRTNNQFPNHFNKNIKGLLNNLRNKENPNAQNCLNWLSQLEQAVENSPEEISEIGEAKEWALKKIRTTREEIKNAEDNDLEIDDLLPSIVYHSEIDNISDSVSIRELNNGRNLTFKNLLTILDIDYSEFNNLDKVDRLRKLDAAETTIKGSVNEIWEQKSVEIDLDFSENEFTVLLKDKELSSKNNDNGSSERTPVTRSLLRPSDRSKGFQWFLSFYINLTAATGDGEETADFVLLDDPAVFLHPEGKRNWLNAIEEMADDTQIIYTSHSPFLIRKEYPSRIRLVEDRNNEGTQISSDFLKSDTSTLEPLRNALGIGLGDSPFVSKKKILVEGASDYFILNSLLNYYKNYLDKDIIRRDDVTIMAVDGGNNMIQAAKWVTSEEFAYVILLDNDKKGVNVRDTISASHPEIGDDQVLLLNKDDVEQNYHIEIEDMFSPTFYIDCVNEKYKEVFDDFEGIKIDKQEGEWVIEDDIEYKGMKLTSKIQKVFNNRGIGDLDKVQVANVISRRLDSGSNVSESDVENFTPILGQINSKF
ncbi:AAA family ATPase [Haloferax prahovense]|uniref:AAA family ATPase n=1 Tax=Haloferax prahovense TaxID=381852 RepID=UPI0009DD51F0|nr:AAA family ATPase [Haloferax prahovense]